MRADLSPTSLAVGDKPLIIFCILVRNRSVATTL